MGWNLGNGLFGSEPKMTKDMIDHPYAYFEGNLITADSNPELDWYLVPDGDGWTEENYVYWFNRVADRDGEQVARDRWNYFTQSIKGVTTFHDFKFNDKFRKWANEKDLYIGENPISDLVVTTKGIVKTAKNVTSSISEKSDESKGLGIVNILMIFAGIWLLTKLLGVLAFYRPYRSNKSNYKNRRK